MLKITRGADFSSTLDFKNADDSPINLTGFTVTAVISWRDGSINAALADVDRSIGRLRMTIDDAITAQIPEGAASTLTITYTPTGGETKKDSIVVEGL
jgi:hypothetical protein